MSQPRGFGLNGKSFYTNIVAPREVHLYGYADKRVGYYFAEE